MGLAFKFGLMEQGMKDIGNTEKLTEKESSIILKVIFLKVNGKTIKLTALEYIFMSMELNMKEIGKMIYKMATELKPGKIKASMKALIKLE